MMVGPLVGASIKKAMDARVAPSWTPAAPQDPLAGHKQARASR